MEAVLKHSNLIRLVALGLLLVNCLTDCQAWNFADGIINSDNSLFNLGLFNEESAELNDKSSIDVQTPSDGNLAENNQIRSSGKNAENALFGGSKPAFKDNSDSQDVSFVNLPQQDYKQSIKGEKGDRGERGEKGECIKEYIAEVDPLTSCSCNFSQIIEEYGDLLRGPKGDRGPRGLDGLPGLNGHPGFVISEGMSGSRMKSGNMFESENFVDPSLIYMSGRRGEPGPPGKQGFPGRKGDKGEPATGIKGDKGERGKRGKNGLRGPPGLPGMPGLPGTNAEPLKLSEIKRLMLEHGVKGEPGMPGLPGPPGPVQYNSWSDNSLTSRSRHFRGKMYDRLSGGETVIEGPPGPPGPPGPKGESGSSSSVTTIVCQDLDELNVLASKHTEGTLAFVTSEQSLMVRVRQGWQYVSMGDIVKTQDENPVEKTNAITNDATTPEPESTSDISTSSQNNRLRLAALNQPFNGDMHGVRGADYECFRQSRRANLKGTFRAFIASRVQNLDSIVRLKDSKLPVVNLKDEILFNSWRDLFTGAGAPFPYPPKIYSFDGRNIFTDSTWSQKLIWHGADKNGIRSTDAYCDTWTSNSISRLGAASNLLRGKLLDQEKYSCNNQFIVLCVEVNTENSSGRHRRENQAN